MKSLLPAEVVARRIYFIRAQKVMVDSDLALMYRVRTKELNKAVKRNTNRFPSDFMFQLTVEEARSLRFQVGTLKTGRGEHGKYLPHVFTEQGVAMLSSVLRSERAALVNIAIMRAFVKLRQALALNKELAAKLEELERKVVGHDAQIQGIFNAIKRLMAGPEKPSPKIGFRVPGRDAD